MMKPSLSFLFWAYDITSTPSPVSSHRVLFEKRGKARGANTISRTFTCMKFSTSNLRRLRYRGREAPPRKWLLQIEYISEIETRRLFIVFNPINLLEEFLINFAFKKSSGAWGSSAPPGSTSASPHFFISP